MIQAIRSLEIDTGNMYFHYPFTWFIYIAAGIFLSVYGIYFIRINLIAKKIRSIIRFRIYIKFTLRLFTLTAVLFALLGPSFGESKKEVLIHSKNILFLMDISLSMNSRDISPSRLEKAKIVIHNIINQNPNDQYGLILYTSGADIQCPFTNDAETFSLFLQTASTSLFNHAGSNPLDAFRLSQRYLSNYNKEGNQKPTILVLITDGEGIDPSVDPIAKESPFSEIIIVGIGSTTGSRIPYLKSFKKDKSGTFVLSILHSESLQSLSQLISGSYFEISDAENTEPSLYARIRNYQGSMEGFSKIEVADNKYFYFLILALVLAITDIIFTIKTTEI